MKPKTEFYSVAEVQKRGVAYRAGADQATMGQARAEFYARLPTIILKTGQQ